MRISIIAALDRDRVIGRDGDLPWRLPADLRRFKRLTMGHHLILGRTTWESIGRPLPGRTMVVLSRGRPELPDGVRLAGSLDQALALARDAGESEAFVAGGGSVYREALPLAGRLYLTRVDGRYPGDVLFPELPAGRWRRLDREELEAGPGNEVALGFEVWERREEA